MHVLSRFKSLPSKCRLVQSGWSNVKRSGGSKLLVREESRGNLTKDSFGIAAMVLERCQARPGIQKPGWTQEGSSRAPTDQKKQRANEFVAQLKATECRKGSFGFDATSKWCALGAGQDAEKARQDMLNNMKLGLQGKI